MGLLIWFGSGYSFIMEGGCIKLFQLKFRYWRVLLWPKASRNFLRLCPGRNPFQLISKSTRFLEWSTISANNASDVSLIWAPARLNFLSWQFPSSICYNILKVLLGLILQLIRRSSSNCLGNYLLSRFVMTSIEPSSIALRMTTKDLKSSYA